MWIRVRRIQWAGHILRMVSERELKQALYEMLKRSREGNMPMDVPHINGSWREMLKYAVVDRDYWQERVRATRQARVRATRQPPVQVEIQSRQKRTFLRSSRIRNTTAETSAVIRSTTTTTTTSQTPYKCTKNAKR